MYEPDDKEILDFAKNNLEFNKGFFGGMTLANVSCDVSYVSGDVGTVGGDVESVGGDVESVCGDVGTVGGKIKQGE